MQVLDFKLIKCVVLLSPETEFVWKVKVCSFLM